jgi:hypothetical protein
VVARSGEEVIEDGFDDGGGDVVTHNRPTHVLQKDPALSAGDDLLVES